MSHIGFSHLPMSCDLGWCHSCYQGGGGVKRWEEGCWWVRGWMEKIMNACILTAHVHLMFFIIDCSLLSFHHWNIQELEGFWLKSQLRIQNLWASRRGVRMHSAGVPLSKVQNPQMLSRSSYSLWHFSHNDCMGSLRVNSNFPIWDW